MMGRETAVLIGPAFPGIASSINVYGNKFSNRFVRFLFRFGFAGTSSKWQTDLNKQATFFDGWFHGLALPFSFILSLFSERIWMFESNTKGFFYKFSTFLGVFLACLLWLPLPAWVFPAILSLVGVKIFATLIAPRKKTRFSIIEKRVMNF